MKFPKKMVLGLSLLFLVLFLTLYFVVTISEYGYSKPSSKVSSVNLLGIALGPEPGDTNVALDTFIRIGTMRQTAVKDLHLTPEVPIARIKDGTENAGIGGDYRFYPAEPLKPATTYNVTVTIMKETVSWNFTTTSESRWPGIDFFIASNVFWASIFIAAAVTSAIGISFWWIKKRKKQTN